MIIFKSIAIYYNKDKAHIKPSAEAVAAFLTEQGVKTKIYDNCEKKKVDPGTDLLISVGGDGTVLHAARGAAKQKLKIFGVNAGNLGFLTSADLTNYKEILSSVIRGKYSGQDLTLLTISIFKDCKYIVKEQTAFNDCVIKTSGARAFTLEMSCDGKDPQKYFGDGVIVATPTGSTAYSLAAGGPMVAPEVDVMLVTPICPHTLAQRPLVLPGRTQIIFTPKFNKDDDYAKVSIDGQISYRVRNGDSILISAAKHKIKLLQAEGYDFLKTLNTKFKWGNR
ncbi:NAD+ kinase [Elusimicrobium posterum]|uniref:NAD(+)/NADH kinase n=1 Tax=Elusimicrobium posterum TaxID=3116653 RepID=UPI003C77C5A3